MHSFLKGHIFARRLAPLTIPEIVAVSGIPDVCSGAFTKDEDIELLVLRPDGNISVHLIPTSRLPRALSWDAACAADESTFDDPRLPDDILRTKQLLGLTLYAERSHGSSAFAALARGLTAMLGGFYEIEGAYFTPEGETLGVPKRAARSRPEPPSPARVAKRALVLCAIAERWRALDTGDLETAVLSMPKVYDWVHAAGIADELTSDERIFLELLPASIGAHAWVRANQGYDAVGVFAWALGVGPRPSLHERADPALAAKLGFLVEERPAILESATLRSADEIASLVEEVKAADARAWEALEKIPPAVLLDPRGSGAEREARANAGRSVMAPVRRRALRWLRGDTISYADSATGLFA